MEGGDAYHFCSGLLRLEFSLAGSLFRSFLCFLRLLCTFLELAFGGSLCFCALFCPEHMFSGLCTRRHNYSRLLLGSVLDGFSISHDRCE